MTDQYEQEDDHRSRQFPVREDMAFQHKVWRFERVGWYVLVLLVILTLLGLFSRGPLSSRELQSNDGSLGVKYEAFHRNGSTNTMVIRLKGQPNAVLEVELGGDWLEGFEVQALQPAPIRSAGAGRGMTLWVQADERGQASLHLSLLGEGLGSYHSRIATSGGAAVSFNQFIFP
ncbi:MULTISPECIES: hypothetical protein [Pseudomonas]|uniref:Uncharacterized protein n=1 Tax=Pseudomonas brassicacearum TaxID=930166 RepID=A0AAJ3FT56_9PSED|nr:MULTISPECIES: hypothetical protein [Pseudomonas]NUT79915.1 hypothetical protein [Pseudomonas brassicacearum]QGA50097.1 hypothetical protein GFU70_13485 [Pseudomonas brassicacearum]